MAAETFGWSQLRDEQLQAMEQVMSGHDVLVVLPTGAGKSAIYQVPALLLDGPTLVVSPLIALQRDQLEGIEDTRAPEAVAVNSAQRGGEHKQAWEAIRQGEAEYVFLSPEQLAKDSKAPEEALGEVVHALQEHDQPIRPAQLKDQVTASATQRTRAVNLFEQAGAVGTTSDGQLEYVDRQYLLGYFGEQLAHPCRNCDTCEAGTAEEQPARDDEFPRGRSV